MAALVALTHTLEPKVRSDRKESVADDDPTTRVWLRQDLIPAVTPEAPLQSPPTSPILVTSDATPPSAPVPVPVLPPLPSAPKASERTPIVAIEIPSTPVLAGRGAPGGRYAKIGAALFGAGVLVGVLGAVGVLGRRAPGALEAAAPAVSVAETTKAAAFTAARIPAIDPVPQHSKPAEARVASSDPAKAASSDPAKAEQLPAELPVSGSTAPTCRQLLGKSLAERNDPKRANTQTALANRELVRGNVDQAQAGYCLALAWDRSNIDRRLNLARLYLLRRDWAKAAEYGQKALEIDPQSRRALGVVGDAWAALHKTKEARAAWLSAERKPKATPSEIGLIVRRNLALAKRVERLRDFSLAERLYRRVLLLDSEHAGAMNGIAGCLLRVGDRVAADAWARKARELKRTATRSRSG